jgi:hypothetical protein
MPGMHVTELDATVCPINEEKRLGYPGFQHCRLHADYQHAFAHWDCHCYTGQCRPTKLLYTYVDTKNENGVEAYIAGIKIFISGSYYRIPLAAYKTEKAEMSEALLEYDAHVCSSEPSAAYGPNIECAWVRLPS